jgi:uncharacterized protein (DUF1501 family)
MTINVARRRFLGVGGAFSAGALFPALAAWAPSAMAQGADYRALVCVFLYGGNDGNNMVVPYDDYASYAAGRGGATGAALDRGELVQIAPAGLPRYGLHPNLDALGPLFAQGKLAVLANVGALTAPLTRAQYIAGATHPRNLFSHSDQQSVWQGLIPGQATPSGWGGRIVDVTGAGNAALAIPGMVSLSGDAIYTIGATSLPVALSQDGALGLAGDRYSDSGRIRYDAMTKILTLDRENLLQASAADVMALAVKSSEALSDALNAAYSAIDTAFQGTNGGVADQLYQCAKLIAARSQLGVTRHGFFTSMGGFDTHNAQRSEQASRFNELGPALAGFQRAMEALGVADKVTTFTLSDFSRTFRVNANAGTDHAWGNHHLVLGGGVRGGTIYGRFPNLAMGGPDDAGDDGQWIPTTAIEQYGATLAKWFGVPTASLPQVFPNLGAFPSADLGFLA